VQEGLVEIREEYVEDEDNDHSDEEESESGMFLPSCFPKF